MTHAIPVRAPRFGLDDVPRDWLGGASLPSRMVDALSLVFPDGERFFIRSVRHYLPRIEDPELRARVRGFFGQEGRHGHEHAKYNRLLERHGFDPERFLSLYVRIAYETIEPRVPPHLRLSATVALEHLTATLAELALDSPLLDDADPELRDLLYWHACEEIEHKAVAFDVLAQVDPRYSTRLIGAGIAVVMLTGFMGMALAMLLRDDGPARETEAGRRFFEELARRRGFLARAWIDYLRPGFHPDDQDNHHLAEAFLRRLDRRLVARRAA